MWAEVPFVLSHCTRLTDRQTDGWTNRQIFDSKTMRMHSKSHGENENLFNGVRDSYKI